nr:venom protein [Lampona murina]
MWTKTIVFIFAANLIMLIAVQAAADPAEETEVALEEVRDDDCKKKDEECWYPHTPCCNQRPCSCNIFFHNCACI